MKKVLVVLAAAGLLFAMSSCTKKCTCKYYVAGVEDTALTPDEVEVGGTTGYKNCADFQEKQIGGYDEATKSGMKCE